MKTIIFSEFCMLLRVLNDLWFSVVEICSKGSRISYINGNNSSMLYSIKKFLDLDRNCRQKVINPSLKERIEKLKLINVHYQ